MKRSVIVCTRNRASRLEGLFRRFLEVAGADQTEFIVVDSCSTDNTQAVLRQIEATSPLRIRIVTADRPGVGHAQNIALAAATGELLIFTDDDCLPDLDFIVRWVAVFQDPRIDYGGGRIELHNHADAPITINTSRSPEVYPPGLFLRTGTIQGANMAFRRDVLVRLGGFDERFGPGALFGSGADIDVAGRASAAGGWGGYFPGPAVSHDHGRKPADVGALRARYDHGRGAYYAKFILDHRTRREYVRNVYWLWRAYLLNNQARLWREMMGALHFIVADRLLHRRSVPHAVPHFDQVSETDKQLLTL